MLRISLIYPKTLGRRDGFVVVGWQPRLDVGSWCLDQSGVPIVLDAKPGAGSRKDEIATRAQHQANYAALGGDRGKRVSGKSGGISGQG